MPHNLAAVAGGRRMSQARAVAGPPDEILVARARCGETGAFEQLVRRHAPVTYRIALRVTGERAAADDVTQEALLTAWRQLGELRDGAAFPGWLCQIAVRRAVRVASSGARQSSLDEAGSLPGRAAGPEQLAIAAELRAALRQALAVITPQQRACWVLRELEGMSYEQIAEITEASPDAVRGRIHRARLRLAQELKPWR